jgi:hypothetical protein
VSRRIASCYLRVMGRGFTSALLFLLLSGLAASAAEPAGTGVEIARSEAESNAKTPAGKRYESVLVSKTEDWLRPAVARCAKNVPKEEIVSFEGLVRVGAEGKAEEVLFGPDTAVARCVAPDFREAVYPRPPQPSWWAKIEVRLK